jgi:hypothetical protein
MKVSLSTYCTLLLLAMFWAGCSGDSTTDSSKDVDQLAEASIGPLGGTLEVPGKVTLIIPPGALDGTVNITIFKNNAPVSLGGTQRFASSVYSIEPSGTELAMDALILIDYNPSSLSGKSEDSVIIQTHDGTIWSNLVTAVDTASNLATASISHLSDFAATVDTASPASGVFAILVIGRSIMYMTSIPYRLDEAVARFDSAYAPCDAIEPLQVDSVTCGQKILTWNSLLERYSYSDYLNPIFITLGAWYKFAIKGGGAAPDLFDSILFPAEEPYVTDPQDGDTVSNSGFSVTWTNSGDGTVRLILMSETDSAIVVETNNSGSYTFTSAQLSRMKDDEYGLVMTHENVEYIDDEGYDPRSRIMARVINTTYFYMH